MPKGMHLLRSFFVWGSIAATFAIAGVPNLNPQLGATEAGQAAADTFKTYTSADVALLPADAIGKPITHDDLSTTLAYPSEGFVVLTVTGTQIKKALEKSLLLYPSPNAGFLQVAGVEISFSKSAPPNSRVTEVKINGSKLEDAHKYQVAMPESLQKGQLGYSDIWEDAKTFHKYPKVSLQDVLIGKHSASSPSRWLAQP